MTPTKVCKQGDCHERATGRGYCRRHYAHERNAGRLQPLTPTERFFTFVDVADCWEWRGSKTRDGYGRFGVSNRLHLAHRWIWATLVGPIPDGYQIDHLCKNPSCVNPDHLEPVTPRVNWSRSAAPSVANARKTHCPKGHPYDAQNTRVITGGGRGCRTCAKSYRETANVGRPL